MFSIVHWLTFKTVFKSIADLISYFITFFSAILYFITKDMHLDLLKRFGYTIIFGSIINNGLTFSWSLKPIKHLKPILPKGTLLGIVILSISTFFVLTDYLEQQKFRFSVSVSIDVISFYVFKKSASFNETTVSLLLTANIIQR